MTASTDSPAATCTPGSALEVTDPPAPSPPSLLPTPPPPPPPPPAAAAAPPALPPPAVPPSAPPSDSALPPSALAAAAAASGDTATDSIDSIDSILSVNLHPAADAVAFDTTSSALDALAPSSDTPTPLVIESRAATNSTTTTAAASSTSITAVAIPSSPAVNPDGGPELPETAAAAALPETTLQVREDSASAAPDPTSPPSIPDTRRDDELPSDNVHGPGDHHALDPSTAAGKNTHLPLLPPGSRSLSDQPLPNPQPAAPPTPQGASHTSDIDPTTAIEAASRTTHDAPTSPRPAKTAASASADPKTPNPSRMSRTPSGSSFSNKAIDIAKSNNLGVQQAVAPFPSTPSTDEFPPTAVRKTSPGLAARLEALGFATFGKKPTPSFAPIPEAVTVGRLDEQQLRELDEKHQAGSINAVIARRGRPWKGAGSFPALPTSPVASDVFVIPPPPTEADPASPPPPPPPPTTTTTAAAAAATAAAAAIASGPTSEPLSLPKIRPPQQPPVVVDEATTMDTNKYRLPDHINGNGTKATLDTRREHLERSVHVQPPAMPSPPQQPSSDAPPLSPVAMQLSSPAPLPSPLPSLSPSPSSPVSTSASPVPASAPSPPPPPPAAAPLAALITSTPADPAAAAAADINSFFSPGHSRPGSVYTLSRASFANQIAQLTSLQLPDAGSLSSKISAIPTAQVAARALINAADQIRSWISKAQEVISGLDSDDDVEWAAAGGREGLEEVENAIARFQGLIDAFVSSINQLRRRADVSGITPEDSARAASQMDAIVREWGKIRGTLQNVRAQVELAMEWEELWTSVLGDIQSEMDELSRLVFEMEERRHQSLAVVGSGDGLDINDLETIVEDSPRAGSRLQASSNRFSIAAAPLAPSSPGPTSLSQDDSNLLALFARMQPLRASLDFLPMRLSGFGMRAEKMFPTACEELEMRREGLDASYKKLEKDAESLRKELGEDRWVIVFRGAGRQAQKMHESVERSLIKLKDAVDAGMHLTNQPSIAKKIESYEAKKTHYGPAVERVLSIIDRGVKDRLTVNGEILRLHHDLQTRWASLKRQIHEMDVVLEDIYADRRSQQLRDSVSSMLSMDHSALGSPRETTPSSSPPSSVIMSSLGLEPQTPASRKGHSLSPNAPTPVARTLRRVTSLLPAPVAKPRNPASRLSTIISSSPDPYGISSGGSGGSIPVRPGSSMGNRPRWNTSTNTRDLDTGHHFRPTTSCGPAPKTPARSSSSMGCAPTSTPATTKSKLPTFRNSQSRAETESPIIMASDRQSRGGGSRLSLRERLTSPGPPPLHRQLSSLTNSRNAAPRSPAPAHMASFIEEDDSSLTRAASPYSANRRSSIFSSALKSKRGDSSRGASPLPGMMSRFTSRRNSNSQASDSNGPKPRWRF